jgi:hypothetical protein
MAGKVAPLFSAMKSPSGSDDTNISIKKEWDKRLDVCQYVIPNSIYLRISLFLNCIALLYIFS